MSVTGGLLLIMLAWLGYDLHHLSHVFITSRNEDTRLNAWTIQQAIDNLLHHPTDLGYAGIFYGASEPFVYTIAPYGIAIMALPVYLLTGQNIVLTYNLYFLATYILTAWAAYLLIHYLLNPTFPIALLMSLMITFAQFRQVHVMHVETLSMEFPLLGLYCLHRLLDESRLRWAISLSVTFGLTMITSGNLAMAFVIIAAIVLISVLIGHRPVLTPRRISLFILAAGFGALILWPFIRFRFGNPVFARGYSLTEIVWYSGTPIGWLTGDSFLYQSLMPVRGEDTLFLGVTPLVLAALAWCCRKMTATSAGSPTAAGGNSRTRIFSSREVVILYGVVILVGYLFTIGPAINLGDGRFVPLPYWPFVHIPGFASIRVTARFILLAVIGTAILGAHALSIITEHYARRKKVLLAVVLIALLIELTPYPYAHSDTGKILTDRAFTPGASGVDTSAYSWLADQPHPTPVFEYPPGSRGVYDYLAQQFTHGQPILDGQGSYLPDWYPLMSPPNFPGMAGLAFLRDRHIRYILVHNEFLTASETTSMRTFLEAESGMRLTATFNHVEVWEILPGP